MAANKVLEGVFAINKPFGMSSAQVIRDCQEYFNPSSLFAPLIEQDKALREKESRYQKHRRGKSKQAVRVKMGHGGTLDPLATGVLILGVGKGTKALQNFLTCTKTYETVVLFGASTDTYDRTGRIIKKGHYDDVTRQAAEAALDGFRGKIRQMPPLYSALKMEGKPLYEYAREGKPIPREIETREVEVAELDLVEWYEPGTHNHRWPTEEAEQAEKNLVDSVWRVAKRQQAATDGELKLTPEQQEEEAKALAEYNSKKREAEERVDSLVSDEQQQAQPQQPPAKRKKTNAGRAEPMMSGALGKLPPKGKGSDLVPPSPAPDTPPPWEGKGPAAAKIRMTVTSGFYVRSLCHDLGEKLGCGAMMAELSRTRQGQFVLEGENCMEYDELLKGEEVWGPKVHRMLDLWNNPNAKAEPKSGEASAAAEEAKGPEESKPAEEGKGAQEDKPTEGCRLPEEKAAEESKLVEDAKPADPVPEPEAASAEPAAEEEPAAAASG
ncbi:pseudouridine synthase [Parachaetomium inaequale]|uniref:tRNA pseudouridine(55) synthase n=1 Tax=Parachaetomium inaequale TaxID=2588326 RepID=A0AAN6SUX7_9PEZI|nr:pseudouridine synthase [Parachaetomium inaequale]